MSPTSFKENYYSQSNMHDFYDNVIIGQIDNHVDFGKMKVTAWTQACYMTYDKSRWEMEDEISMWF